MPNVSPDKELANAPVPVPSVVLLPVIVGFADVLQQTPRTVTFAPPSLIISPPAVAVDCAIEEAAVVVRIGYVAPVHDGMLEAVSCKN